jgi:dTMP kinase
VARARRRNKAQGKEPGSGGHDENRFEKESRAFFGRVHQAYLGIAKREPERVARVDARGTAEATHRRIMELVRQKLKLAARTL